MPRALCIGFLLALTSATGLRAQSAPSDFLLAGANARIEAIRRADAIVVVQDAGGRPVRNVTVTAAQTRHAFLFGCAALSLLKHADPAKETLYQKRFADLFNFATVLTYWQDTEPEPGRTDIARISALAKQLKGMNVRVKGHPLILAGACPRWAPADPDVVRDLTRNRIAQLVRRFKGQIDTWDVVGDATTASGAQNGLGAWARKSGAAAFTADALTWTHAANPAAVLLYNDYKLDTDYLGLVRNLQGLGAPLDVLGLEAHMIPAEWPLQKVWDTAETFSVFMRPLHFSEITVLSDDPGANHGSAWPSTPEGEKRQADYVEKLYTLLFSHPAVQSIGWWNFADGDWDRNPGGLLRSDLSAKPAYTRLLALIRHKWHTIAVIKTGANGACKFRGFAGGYRISAVSGKTEKTVTAEIAPGRENRIVIRMP